MYDVIYVDDCFWISKDGNILKELGSFIEPISPKIIIEEIRNEEI